MRRKIARMHLITALLALVSGCNYQTPKYPEFKKVLSEIDTTSDSIRIPKKKNGDTLQIYHLVQDWSRQLELDNFDTAIHSFQLRMWIDIPGLSLRQRLFILNYYSTTDDFSAELFRFEDRRVSARDLFSNVFSVKKKLKVPRSGWPSFTKDMFSEDFLFIFDENNGYIDQAYMDSDSYCFEIITDRNYWFSNFGALHEDESNRKVVRLIKRIFTLIESEFDFRRV